MSKPPATIRDDAVFNAEALADAKVLTCPDMGRSVSDEMVEVAYAAARVASGDPVKASGHFGKRVIRAALEAAERLRAPVGGDDIVSSELNRLLDRLRGTEHFYLANAVIPKALAAMARVRCAIPDGWRVVPVEATEPMLRMTVAEIIRQTYQTSGVASPNGMKKIWSEFLSAAPTLPISFPAGAKPDGL